uniref:site-specific DNA-methyltransferase (adenine-specific) n=1 Tax=viral metagenome TaxID=1070528 RepID=A0A6C0ETA4_9ZZZZ
MAQYSELSKKMTKELSKKEKKEQGIFITPKSIIQKLFEYVDMSNVTRILEPSCGTCEIINYLNETSGISIVGIEKNEKIFKEISKLPFKNVSLIHGDFLDYKGESFDLIVGNPPYFVLKKENVPSQYEKYICGRPNIFGLFILKSLELLKEDGILAFIIPTSFLNSAYYELIRKHIVETCSILSIQNYGEMNDFVDTEQSTMGLIIKKCIPTCFNYSLDMGRVIFTDKLDKINELLVGSTTLKKMGLLVRTGQIVWNQHKDKLSDEGTLLIYNSNLSDENTIITKTFKNDEKKQYIKLKGRTGTTMVVNRGNGNAAYVLKYAIVTDEPYLIENHLNEIYSKTPIDPSVYESIKYSFANPKTQEFIKIFLGNNGLSKTELETIFPIYL